MKLLLFLLLFQPQRFFEYGITALQHFDTPPNIQMVAKAVKGDAYIDLKIHVTNEKIISPIFIETNKGKFAAQVYEVNKYGYSILRLFFRLKEQWTSIDSGITFITVKTDKKTYRILINDNLSKLKNYALNK